ncbi:MAG: ABC transporter permease [Bacteroidota bacterium]
MLNYLISAEMLLNYIKVGFRNILSNKLSTLINALGMALAIGCCLVAFQFIYWWTHMDDFHSKRDEVYILQREMTTDGIPGIWNDVPQPLGKAIAEEFTQVEAVARVNYNRGTIKHGENIFNEWVSFVDPAYHNLFDFEIKWGNREDFGDYDGVVLAEAISKKYFGDENPVGELIKIRFSALEEVEEFTVKGVLKKVPGNASFSNNIILPFERQKNLFENMEDWTYHSTITFLQIPNPEDIKTIKAGEQKYLDRILQLNENWDLTGLHFQALTTIAQNGYKIENNPFHTSHNSAIIMLTIIAIVLLILVCFNYINISLASASSRLKEISVRKVLGSNRGQIIWQFLSENLIICLLALGLGIVLASYLFLPWFNSLSGNTLEISYFKQAEIWGFTLVLVIITAIGGAGYPALYISKFQPVKILKREFSLVQKGRFQKFLIGTQLLFTILTIFSTLVLFLTSKHLKAKDWGYQQQDIVVISLEKDEDFEKLKNEIERNSNVMEVSGSQDRLGERVYPEKVIVDGVEHDIQKITVAPNYVPTYGITLSEGRNFNTALDAENQESVLVNEAFMHEMNWKGISNRQLKIGDQIFRVIGVVQDFHNEDFFVEIKPLIFQTKSVQNYPYLSARVLPGTAGKAAQELEKSWYSVYPNVPYTYDFQAAAFDNYFNHFTQINAVLGAASFMTVLVAIIGLFGLAMLLLTKKMKELSIRKVLGANSFQISHVVIGEFFYPVLIATLVGLAAGFFMLQGLLQQIAPSASIGWIPFLLTILLIILMLSISLGKHIHTALSINPARYIKEE